MNQPDSNNRPKILWAAVLIILLAHSALLLAYFGGFRSLFSDQPLIHWDHSWHFYYSILGSQFLVEHGTTWGYDPFLMAGYPTEIFDTSDRLIKVLMVPMHLLSLERGYKIIVFSMAAAMPLLFFAAALWFGMKPHTVTACTALGTLVCWAGGAHSMFILGMTGFPLISIYGIALAALFLRSLRRPSRAVNIALIIAAPLGLLIHPGIVLIFAAPGLVFYIIYFKKLSLSRHLFIMFICFWALAANLFWILPYIENLAFKTPSDIFFQNPFEVAGWNKVNVYKKLEVAAPAILLVAVLVEVAAGFKSFRRRGRNDLTLGFVAIEMLLIFVFTLGAYIPLLRDTEPVRFYLPCLFALVFPAAEGLESWFHSIWQPRLATARLATFSVALAICLFLFSTIISSFFAGLKKDPFVGMNAGVSAARDWIIANTDRSARILIEDNSPFYHGYGSAFASTMLVFYTGRELIGGPHWVSYLLNHFADLSGLILFGRFIGLWNESSLSEYMTLYNIGWVGAFSPPVRDLFDAHPSLFKPIGEAGGFRFYALSRRHTFFIEGSGEVRSDYNRLMISDVSPRLKRVIISYHWHPRLRVKPPAKIERVMIGRDPVGFIGIINPQPEMEIKTKYW